MTRASLLTRWLTHLLTFGSVEDAQANYGWLAPRKTH